jgi:hypothetical protein
VPVTSARSSKGIFVVASNSTNQTDEAGSMCQYSVYFLYVVYGKYLDVYVLDNQR